MRTLFLAGLLLCSGACAHAQLPTPGTTPMALSSQGATVATERCARSDDDEPDAMVPCPVQGLPGEQEVTRMTSLLQPRDETTSTADASPTRSQQDVDDMGPVPASVAEDAQ